MKSQNTLDAGVMTLHLQAEGACLSPKSIVN
jgi:hypothetical protein